MERSTKHEAKLILTWLISVHGCDQAYIAFMCRSWFLLRFLRRSGTLGPPRVRGFLPKYGILESPYVVALTYDNYTHRVAPRNFVGHQQESRASPRPQSTPQLSDPLSLARVCSKLDAGRYVLPGDEH